MICRDTPFHGSLCGWVVGWVGQWVASGQMTKNLINRDLIKIIQFPPMGGCVGGWVGQWVNGWGWGK